MTRPLDGTWNTTAVAGGRNRAGRSSRLREPVYLEATELTVRQNGTAKISIHNRTSITQRFSLTKLSKPFVNFHDTVEVKPHFYLHVPVKFIPDVDSVAEGRQFETQAILRNLDNETVLVCRLVGILDNLST